MSVIGSEREFLKSNHGIFSRSTELEIARLAPSGALADQSTYCGQVHILIATAGALPPAAVVDLVTGLWSPGSTIIVMSSIEVPRSFLEELDTEEWRPFADTGMSAESERQVARYVDERGRRLVQPILSGLDAAGLSANPLFVESSDPATAIIETAVGQNVELIIMGATRPIFTEDVWQSVAVKVMQASSIPVVMIPGLTRTPDEVGETEGAG